MFKIKSLAVGLAASLGASAALAVNFQLDATTADTARTFATGSFDSTDVQTVGSVTYPNINSGTLADLGVDANIGVGVSDAAQIFVRYDITNGFFGTVPTLSISAAGSTAPNTIAQGGTAGASFAIFQLTASGALSQISELSLNNAKYAVNNSAGDLGIKMRVFETLTTAIAEGTALNTATATSVAKFVSGVTTVFTANATTPIADVETDFAKFTAATGAGGGTTLGNIGTLTVTHTAGVADAGDGNAVNLADMVVVGTSPVVITGDFGQGTVSLFTNAACSTGTFAITANTAKTDSTNVNVDDVQTAANLCYATKTATVIPEQTYTGVITFTKATNAAQPIGTVSGTFGKILHNGTTVQIPYLTTFSDYNQRLVIVNRGSSDATYSITFQQESGVTAVAGTAATGTITKGQVLSIKVTDIVTLTGKTRAAGTLTIVAADANISVATTQVNLSDKSTDTISLN